MRPSGARMVKCKYTLLITAPSYESAFARIAQRLEDEVVVEGTLHVTTVQAGSCMDRYGNMQNMQKRTAPPLASLANALVQDSSVGDSQLLQEAVCLATPPDNPSENQRGAGYVMRQVRSAQADIRWVLLQVTSRGSVASSTWQLPVPKCCSDCQSLLA